MAVELGPGILTLEADPTSFEKGLAEGITRLHIFGSESDKVFEKLATQPSPHFEVGFSVTPPLEQHVAVAPTPVQQVPVQMPAPVQVPVEPIPEQHVAVAPSPVHRVPVQASPLPAPPLASLLPAEAPSPRANILEERFRQNAGFLPAGTPDALAQRMRQAHDEQPLPPWMDMDMGGGGLTIPGQHIQKLPPRPAEVPAEHVQALPRQIPAEQVRPAEPLAPHVPDEKIAALPAPTLDVGRAPVLQAAPPLQVGASYPGTPASATVGKSGKPGERRAPLTASARTVPAFACGAIELRLSNIRCTRPAIRSLIAAAPPR